MTDRIGLIHQEIQTSIQRKYNSRLTRDDFDSGPVSLDPVEENLWLGNLKAACDLPTLHKYKITHILTVDSVPLPRVVSEFKNITNKYIHVADIPKEDIISHFPEALEFIKNGQEKGTVLVHCYYGMSRSATIVIAHMMARHKLTFEEAFHLVKFKRTITCPNKGFMSQLKLFGLMECKLDKEFPKYKQFRLKIAAENVRKVKILPQFYADLVKSDPGLTRERPEPLVYRCKKCRRIVASQKNIIPHLPHQVALMIKEKSSQKRTNRSERQKSSDESKDKFDLSCVQNGQNLIEKLKTLACGSSEPPRENIDADANNTQLENSDEEKSPEMCQQTYFIEPLAWMNGIHRNVQGKLYCPKCTNKLGSFSWTMGCNCPCGAKVAPAFYLVPSKVEWSNVVQNVQVTV